MILRHTCKEVVVSCPWFRKTAETRHGSGSFLEKGAGARVHLRKLCENSWVRDSNILERPGLCNTCQGELQAESKITAKGSSVLQ